MPKGVAISRPEGEWHVAFVADEFNDRIAVFKLGSTCQCEQWLGEINAKETGVPLHGPTDVAWDAGDTWRMDDDRLFIADAANGRVVVYALNINASTSAFSAVYLGSFRGDPSSVELQRPVALALSSPSSNTSHVLVGDQVTGRVSRWEYGTRPRYAPIEGATLRDVSAVLTGTIRAITTDHENDVFVAVMPEANRSELLKLNGAHLSSELARIGRGGSWSNGEYAGVTSIGIVPAHTQNAALGQLVTERLPYMGVTETWSDNTGGQLVRLGTSIQNARAEMLPATYPTEGLLRFRVPSSTLYNVAVYNAFTYAWNPATAPVRVIATSQVARPGDVSLIWDGRDAQGNQREAGQYLFVIKYGSAYSYDDGLWSEVTALLNYQPVFGTGGSGGGGNTGGGGGSTPTPAPIIYGLEIINPGYTEYWASGASNVPAGSSLSFEWHRAEYDSPAQWQFVGSSDLYGGELTHECGFTLKLVMYVNLQAYETYHTVQGYNASSYGCPVINGNLSPAVLATSDVPDRFFANQRLVSRSSPLGLRRLEGAAVRGNLAAIGDKTATAARDGVRGVLIGIPASPRVAGQVENSTPSSVLSVPIAVRLSIVDMAGRGVRDGVSELLTPGVYEYTWDARDSRGQEVPPGVYFARVSVGTNSRVVKLVLVR